jgi:hypothetical protein
VVRVESKPLILLQLVRHGLLPSVQGSNIKILGKVVWRDALPISRLLI